MAEPPGVVLGNPDPSTLTTAQLDKAIDNVRIYVDGQLQVRDERLTGMDKANDLRLGGINGIPEAIDSKVVQLEHLISERVARLDATTEERFRSTDRQFELVEAQRTEQKVDTKSAVDAALIAQKEAVREQTTASERAIAKSEAATSKQLEQLNGSFSQSISNVLREIADVKERISKVESLRQGGKEAYAGLYALAGVVAAVVGVVAFFLGRG